MLMLLDQPTQTDHLEISKETNTNTNSNIAEMTGKGRRENIEEQDEKHMKGQLACASLRIQDRERKRGDEKKWKEKK